MLSRHGSKAPDLANGARTFTCRCSSMTSGCSVRRDSRSKTRCDTTRRIRSRASWRSKRTRGMFYRQALRLATSWITFAESWSGLKANSCKGGISHKRHRSDLFVPFVANFSGPDEGILRVRCQTLGFRQAKFFLHDVRSTNQSNGLIVRVPPAHSFAPHTAVCRYRETFGRNELQGLTQQVGHLFGAFHLQRMVIDNAYRDFLSRDSFADGLEIQRV